MKAENEPGVVYGGIRRGAALNGESRRSLEAWRQIS